MTRPKTRTASGPVLSSLLTLALGSAVPALAFADGSEIVTGIVAATPPPPAAPEGSPSPESATPSTPATELRVAALVTGGVAVIGVAAGVAFGVLALNDKSRFDDVASGALHLSTVQADHTGNLANENAVLADVCFGGAVAAAVTSLVLLVKANQTAPVPAGSPPSVSGPAPKERALYFTVAPMFTTHGAGAGAALIF